MVNQNMAVANGRNPDFDPDVDFANSASLVNADLGAFVSPDELEEFLRNFDGGEVDEAVLQTQGKADIGGEPLDTVH